MERIINVVIAVIVALVMVWFVQYIGLPNPFNWLVELLIVVAAVWYVFR